MKILPVGVYGFVEPRLIRFLATREIDPQKLLIARI
jgi:hypothetical protein